MAEVRYVECAGVRIPAHWDLPRLREALAKRKVRFANERELMEVFGNVLLLKDDLEKKIASLIEREHKLVTSIDLLGNRLLFCPKRGNMALSEAVPEKKSENPSR